MGRGSRKLRVLTLSKRDIPFFKMVLSALHGGNGIGYIGMRQWKINFEKNF